MLQLCEFQTNLGNEASVLRWNESAQCSALHPVPRCRAVALRSWVLRWVPAGGNVTRGIAGQGRTTQLGAAGIPASAHGQEPIWLPHQRGLGGRCRLAEQRGAVLSCAYGCAERCAHRGCAHGQKCCDPPEPLCPSLVPRLPYAPRIPLGRGALVPARCPLPAPTSTQLQVSLLHLQH